MLVQSAGPRKRKRRRCSSVVHIPVQEPNNIQRSGRIWCGPFRSGPVLHGKSRFRSSPIPKAAELDQDMPQQRHHIQNRYKQGQLCVKKLCGCEINFIIELGRYGNSTPLESQTAVSLAFPVIEFKDRPDV